ncbi:MAG: hypothetical protein ABSG81_05325 [Acidimicrobiales bacterium]|jgi:hypothetical protein
MGDLEYLNPGEPPDDPEAWTDEQWIAWLQATDDPDAPGGPRPHPRRWRDRRTASALGAAMMGLHEVIYGRKDEVAIVIEAGGDPPNDDLPEVLLDPEHGEVIVRHRPASETPPTEDPEPGTDMPQPAPPSSDRE